MRCSTQVCGLLHQPELSLALDDSQSLHLILQRLGLATSQGGCYEEVRWIVVIESWQRSIR